MSFSGLANPGLTTYLANTGVEVTAILNQIPINFPIAAPRTFEALSVNLNTPPTGAPGSTITITVFQDGLPTGLTTTIVGPASINTPQTVAVPVSFAVNQRFDLQVTTTGIFVAGPIGISATIATSP